ncbi:MAG: 2-vinyl bacteriochlorophyllide hydratase [Hasllibacter sp.]
MAPVQRSAAPAPLYSPEERERRDASPWTAVQGVLAPVQFAAFVVSLWLMARWYAGAGGFGAAAWSVVVKTALLLTIMVTGSIWEREVFGRWLFAPAFFWEDVVSMGVIALHLAYLAAFLGGWLAEGPLMVLALAAYAAYLVNFAQFVWKLRLARVSAVPA